MLFVTYLKATILIYSLYLTKMRKFSLYVFIAVCISGLGIEQTYAQTNINLRAGINWSQARYLHTLNSSQIRGRYIPAFVVGWNIGIPVEFSVTDRFAIQPEFSIVSKGFQTHTQFYSSSIPREIINSALLTVRKTSLETPVMFKYYFSNSFNGIYVMAGPSIEWFLRQKDQYVIYPLQVGDVKVQEYKFSDLNNRLRIGYGAGVGFINNLGSIPVFMEIRYQTSWIEPNFKHVYDSNSAFTFSVGARISKLKKL
ncbi:hypothetical protein GCM10023187_56170 [Nibrella viscosa]|uniref:Outer membrane protein beta-barrel domain-containing protein n=2 Tax=Nibrella viscosa TaxID=1084524 RepID=A0ABP8L349_9BACT